MNRQDVVFLLVDDRLHVVLLVDDFRVLAHEVLLHEGRILHDEVGASAGLGLVGVGGHVGVVVVVECCCLMNELPR